MDDFPVILEHIKENQCWRDFQGWSIMYSCTRSHKIIPSGILRSEESPKLHLLEQWSSPAFMTFDREASNCWTRDWNMLNIHGSNPTILGNDPMATWAFVECHPPKFFGKKKGTYLTTSVYLREYPVVSSVH